MQQKNKDKKLTNKTNHENIVDIANFYKWDMKRQHRENFITDHEKICKNNWQFFKFQNCEEKRQFFFK